ncbi:MAG: TolC family protein, partial [Isosphaeraceae bacterium]
MRLTFSRNRWTRASLLATLILASGCQKLPYIDESKPVPHDNMDRVAREDSEVKKATLLSASLPMQMPKVAKPRTTNDPEAQEVWPMT